MSDSLEVLILAPTPNEYRSVSNHVGRGSFKNLNATVIECGPGRINAAYTIAREICQRPPNDIKKFLLIGAGTSGTLALHLVSGDIIVSNEAIISDWRMEDGQSVKVSPYGWFDYRDPDPGQVVRMVLECRDPLVTSLIDRLSPDDYKFGRLLTSESFVAGKDHKLSLGKTFSCLACDMESGAFAFVADRLINVPWVNIRVIADTLDDALNDYFAIERDMTEILGTGVVNILKALDQIYKP
jgi:nucleoside phosphorylase